MTLPGALRSLPFIERLVGFDTTSRDSNLALIHWARDYLAELGIAATLVHDDAGGKANLIATIGPRDRAGYVLSGHTDVVPVDGQPWDTDPFRLTQRDGRLYGRGTCDMKSFLAVALAFAGDFQRAATARPVHLCLSYDEEVGCLGAPRMIAELGRQGLKAIACFVGEPTGMQVIDGHKGKLALEVRARGLECHSSMPQAGVNAVEAIGEAIAFLKRMQRRKRDEGPFDPRFDPPYTTVHVGVVDGGTALNIVPRDARCEFEIRALPGEDPEPLIAELEAYLRETLEPEMIAVDPACGFVVERVCAFPGLDAPADSEAVRLAQALSGANGASKVAFGTEAGLFQTAGIPTVVVGPGSIEQAHKPNEFIALEQVAACERFMERLCERLAA